MLKLLWLLPREGWAFYEEDGQYYQIRGLVNKEIYPVLQETMETIIYREGYRFVEKNEFETLEEVRKFIKDKYVEAQGGPGKLKKPTEEQIRQMINSSGDELLIKYINKAIDEWIPNNRLRYAIMLYDDFSIIPNIEPRKELLEALEKLKVKIDEANKI